MTISLRQLKKRKTLDKVIIHSLDLCLYQASVLVEDEEQFVTDNNGKLLRSHNVLAFQAMFEPFVVKAFVMRHQSAYDEMVGQPLRQGSNVLEVPFGNNRLASDSLPTVH